MKLESNKVDNLFSASYSPVRSMALPGDVLPGVSIIGCGYNPYIAYADGSAVLNPVLDWSKCTFHSVNMNNQSYQVPEILNPVWLSNHTYFHVSGKTFQSYLTELSNSINVSGSYGFFSASATNEFTDSSLRKSENEFCRYQESFNLWKIIAPNDIARLQDYLTDDFKNLVNAIDPNNPQTLSTVFDVYGSHVLMGGVMGGKARISAWANKLTLTRKFDMTTIVKAEYDELTAKISAEDKLKYAEALESFSESGSYSYEVLGGSPSLGALVFKLNNQNSDDRLKNWVDSISTMPVLTDFIDNNSLLPVWQLIVDQSKAQALQAYYQATWSQQQMLLTRLRSNYIDAVTFVLGDNSDTPAPDGYTKVPVDLNSGAGGKYIYLCYHETPYTPINTKQAIVALQVLYGKQQPAPGYQKIDVDLNSGAGGEFVYLSYKLGDAKSNDAINRITAVYGKDQYVPTPYGYIQISGDLNAGAGGDFVYFCTFQGGLDQQ